MRLSVLLGFSLFVGTRADQTIQLPKGWSIFSTYIDSSLDMDTVFDGTDVQIVKNNDSEVYWKEFGFNGIGNITPLEGYQIKMPAAATITIVGNPLNTFDLKAGLNLVGHISEPQNVAKVFEDMNVNWVKDAYGNLYVPQYDINDIWDMQPGRGYWVNMLSAKTLQWQSGKESLGYPGEMYTANGALTNTGSNMNVIFDTAWFSEGSTIRAKCDDIDVGELIIDKSKTFMAITVWGDDGSTEVVDGCASDGYIDYTIETLTGSTGTFSLDTFSVNAVQHVSVIALNEGVSGCTDSTVTNYNVNAVLDDGSCTSPGCTYAAANNYDEAATTDDGSCDFTQCINPADSSLLAAAVRANAEAYQMAGLCD